MVAYNGVDCFFVIFCILSRFFFIFKIQKYCTDCYRFKIYDCQNKKMRYDNVVFCCRIEYILSLSDSLQGV